MQIEYKCPICRANNILSEEDTICRRCKSELSSIFKLKQDSVYEVLQNILKKGNNDIQ